MNNIATNNNQNPEFNLVNKNTNEISNINKATEQKQESEIKTQNQEVENIESNTLYTNTNEGDINTQANSENQMNVIDLRSKNQTAQDTYKKRLETDDALSMLADKKEGKFIEEVKEYTAQNDKP